MAPRSPQRQRPSHVFSHYDDGYGGGGGRGRQPPPHRGGGLLLGVVYLFLFVLVAAASAVGYLVLNPPSDLIRQKITEQVRAQTGRELTLAGPASVVFFPKLGVSLKDVSLSGPAGTNAKLISMQSLDVSVNAMTLLSRKIDISTLVLRKPVFDLRIDKDGRKNWDFAADAVRTRFAELKEKTSARDYDPIVIAAADDAGSQRHLGQLSDLHFEDVRLEDGTFSLTDERTGRSEQVGSINAKIGLDSLASPLTASGNLAWRGEQIDFDGKVADVRAVLRNAPAQLSLAVQSPKLQASYDGDFQLTDSVALDGRVGVQSPSTRDLARWFGTVLPPVPGFGPLSIQGHLKTASNVTTFSGAQFGLDNATAKGTITVTTGGVRPRVDAKLAISELDLNKYLTSAVTATLPAESASPQTESADEPDSGTRQKPDAIEKLLNAPGTKVYGSVQRAGWSSEQFNLALLNVADGNADLSVDRLKFKKMTIGQSSLTIAVKDRAMRADFSDIALYEGHGKGVLIFSGGGAPPVLKANFSLDDVAAQPFLRDAADFDRIAGRAKVNVQVSAIGSTQLALVESLSGTTGFTFTDGAIVGFNVPGAIRGLSQGSLAGFRTTPSAKTDFASLQATFDVTNGVAENSDLQLLSPLLRVTGGGKVNLPERTIDYTIKPKLVASIEGQQTSDSEGSGLEIPVRISGSWDNPRYQPDLNGIVANPDKAIDAIKSIGKQFKGKSAGEIVNDLFGKKNGDGNSDQGQSAGDILKKLFKKPQDNN